MMAQQNQVSGRTSPSNAIIVIHPYQPNGIWMFDDARLGILQEPFFSGADVIMNHLAADIPRATNGFTLIFSASPFPGYQYEFERRREEFGGHWYFSPDYNIEGWLCPALFKYFEDAPPRLFVQAKRGSQ
jgi:hypothetical protein